MNLSQLLSKEQSLRHTLVKLKAKISLALLMQQDSTLLTSELDSTEQELQYVCDEQLKELKAKMNQT